MRLASILRKVFLVHFGGLGIVFLIQGSFQKASFVTLYEVLFVFFLVCFLSYLVIKKYIFTVFS